MEKIKLVDYSDSESESEEQSSVPHTAETFSTADTFSVKDSQGRQVAIVEPTPQNVAVVHPMDSSSDEDLDGTGIFEPELDSALSTQATHGSSSPNAIDPSFVSQEIAESLQIEIPREDIIVISDSSQETVIVLDPGEVDDHRSDTSGKYPLLFKSNF